jgi:hypothetical protein
MNMDFQELATFSLWAGVEVAHPAARLLGAIPAECYDADSTSSINYVSVWCELADRPRHDIEAMQIVGLFMPPEQAAARSGFGIVGQRIAPPVLVRAHVVHIGPKPGHQRVPGEPTPYILHLDVERW